MKDLVKSEKFDSLFYNISQIIVDNRKTVNTTVNTVMVKAYFEIGKYIIEFEQVGNKRAEYGKSLLKNISEKLTEKFGDGWSVENLTLIRKFYTTYSSKIVNGDYDFHLSWSHYIVLMRIENPDERNFYEIECAKEQWSVRTLKRQFGSSLYERLALSKNKEAVIRLSKEGQTIEKADDIYKNPVALEFLGIKSSDVYTETKLENAIITKMQMFLLEMGKGFLFEKRQKNFFKKN